MPGEREHDQRRDGDEVADVAHPVVVRPLLVGPRREEAVARVRPDDRAAEHHVGDQPVHVDGHPRRVGDGVPQLDRRRVGRRADVPRRRHHISEPGVGDEHHDGAPDVEEDAQGPVAHLGPPLLPAVPAVVVEVEREGLEEEQPGVDPRRVLEDGKQVGEEARVERGEEEQQDGAPDGRRAVGHEQETREFLAQPVVALVAAEDADRFRHDGEHRHAQHERRKHQMDLRRDPHRRPGPDDRELAVGPGRIGGGLDEEQDV